MRFSLLRVAALAFLCLPGAAQAVETETGRSVLRVCADPNSLPYSNRAGEGFENRLADLVAKEMGARVEYFWWAQRRGFLRNSLKAGNCDVVMGVPADYEMAATTKPYYRSAYVFVYRADRGMDLHSIRDPRLADYRIGVDVIGDDGVNTPPAHALGRQGLTDNVEGYMIYGDYEMKAPQARITQAVAKGDIDLGAVWGPTAGYFAKQSEVPLRLVPITGTEGFEPLRFDFSIAMGVRREDEVLRRKLDAIIDRRHGDITRILASYGVPMLPLNAGNDGGETVNEKGEGDAR